MTRVHFLQCVLVQVLLIAPCFSADSYLNCSDINGTVGEPLNLTCTLKCEEPCKIELYKWKYYNKAEWMLLNKSKLDLTDKFHPFHHDFTPTKDHNGTFQFWVQLDLGAPFKNFTVRLSEKVPPVPSPSEEVIPDVVPTPEVIPDVVPTPESTIAPQKGLKGPTEVAIIMATVASVIIIVLTLTFWFKRTHRDTVAYSPPEFETQSLNV